MLNSILIILILQVSAQLRGPLVTRTLTWLVESITEPQRLPVVRQCVRQILAALELIGTHSSRLEISALYWSKLEREIMEQQLESRTTTSFDSIVQVC